ncbi:MAG: hypothetical protein MOB07_20365 [Acidobacteria bacterium]|nr:hypothetical protein [Acidobacteriota bacterium]
MQFKHYRLRKTSLQFFVLFFAIIPTVEGQQPIRKVKSNTPRRISFAEAQRILASENEGNIAKQPNKFSRTRLSDGQVLEVYYPISARSRSGKSKIISVAGYGVLYESEMAFNDATRPRHMLEDLIPDGHGLVDNIPQLVARLEKRLRLRAGKLDYTRSSLKRLDLFIAGFHSSHTTANTNPRLFEELTAYYGETLRRALGGAWRVRNERVDEKHVQTEPNISFNSEGKEKEIKPWSSVISALYDEENRGIGLTRVFDADLAAAR